MTDTLKPEYPVTREALYELAWSQPMTSIAKIYDVSSSYLARVYSTLDVPRPAPGYWAKVAASKTVSKPELPEPKAGTLLEWDRYNDSPIYKVAKPKPPRKRYPRSDIPKLGKPEIHPLISGAKKHFLKTRDSEIDYIRPYKKNLVDLVISKKQLDIALNLANNLFSSFEDYGYQVCLTPTSGFYFCRPSVDERIKPNKNNRFVNHWSPGRETIVYVGTVAIGLTIFEYSEQLEAISEYKKGKQAWIKVDSKIKKLNTGTWTTTHDFPTGRFCLRAYSPYQGTSWIHDWNITDDMDIFKFGHKVVKEMTAHAKKIAKLVKKAEKEAEIRRKEWEAQKQQWEIEKIQREQQKANEESHKELMQLIDKWREFKRINSFFDEIEKKAQELPQDTRATILERLHKAREMIGKTDALQEILNWRTPEELLSCIKNRPFW